MEHFKHHTMKIVSSSKLGWATWVQVCSRCTQISDTRRQSSFSGEAQLHINSSFKYTLNQSTFNRSVCSGLAYLHDTGIVHRDIKWMAVCLDSSSRMTWTQPALLLATRCSNGCWSCPGRFKLWLPKRLLKENLPAGRCLQKPYFSWLRWRLCRRWLRDDSGFLKSMTSPHTLAGSWA